MKSMIKKWEVFGTTRTFPGSGRPSKHWMEEQQETAKRGYQEARGHFEGVTGIWRIFTHHCVHVSIISPVRHKCGMFQRKKEKDHVKARLSFARMQRVGFYLVKIQCSTPYPQYGGEITSSSLENIPILLNLNVQSISTD